MINVCYYINEKTREKGGGRGMKRIEREEEGTRRDKRGGKKRADDLNGRRSWEEESER